MGKRLSYSVVFYNQSIEEIDKLLDNILETIPQTVEQYTIFLINNSVQNKSIIRHLDVIQKHDKHVVSLFPTKNGGYGAGHNLGIMKAQSDIHIIVNPDIRIPNASQIKDMIDVLDEEKAGMLVPKILYPDGGLQPLVKHNPTVLDMAIRFLSPRIFPERQAWFNYLQEGYEHKIYSANLPGSFMVCNTKILQEVGGFDERYFLYMEDSDLSRKISEQKKTLYTPKAYVEHELQRANRTSFSGQKEMIKSMFKYFNKWGWRLW